MMVGTTTIVQSLLQLPEVAGVEYTGPADAPMTLIHLRDWHHVPRELCKLDGIDFEENLAIVSKVQDDQLAIARFLIREQERLLRRLRRCEGVSELPI